MSTFFTRIEFSPFIIKKIIKKSVACKVMILV
nr:MAG TPA: hypothetical protein [Caudoviricetes sp.]